MSFVTVPHTDTINITSVDYGYREDISCDIPISVVFDAAKPHRELNREVILHRLIKYSEYRWGSITISIPHITHYDITSNKVWFSNRDLCEYHDRIRYNRTPTGWDFRMIDIRLTNREKIYLPYKHFVSCLDDFQAREFNINKEEVL